MEKACYFCRMDYRYARQSTGWIYVILMPFIHVVYRLMFRKIYLHNHQTVKPNTPVLIAANHPTAFIDPIFFCLFFDPPVYNMTRGDIFRKPFFRKLLMSCNMFPVFRLRDGFDGRERNDDVFEFCKQKLHSRVAVNIFVEGEHHLDKRVLPAKKGIARIAFGTYEQYRLEDLQVIPVGCNYVDGTATRDEAKIIVGKPIFVKDYWPLYEKSPGAAITQLCRDIEQALKKICYQVDDPNDDVLADQLLKLWRNTHAANRLPILETQAPRFFGEKAVLDRLNELAGEPKQALREKTTAYFSTLNALGLEDEGLVHPEHANFEWLLFLVLLAPIALLGYVITWPIRWTIYTVARKKIKKAEFYTSVLMGLGVLVGGIYIAILLATGILLNISWLITLALLMPLLSWVGVFWKEQYLRWCAARKSKAHSERAYLLRLRQELANLISL